MSKRRVKTPATDLYDYWLMVLKGSGLNTNYNGRLIGSINFGRNDYYGIGPVDGGTDARPNIAFGYVRWNIAPKFVVTHDGDFQLASMHGWKQRDAVERNTFLTWVHGFRQYGWTADPMDSRNKWKLDDWNDAFPYTPEWAMELSYGCNDANGWLTLAEIDGQWHIQPSPRRVYGSVDSKDMLFARAERRREFRYRRAERAHLRAMGELPPLRQVDTEEREERRLANREEAINVILAGFDIRTPAQTTPLRRNREEGLWEALPGPR